MKDIRTARRAAVALCAIGWAACGGTGGDGPMDSGAADAVAPRVVSTLPPHGAVDVYPARIYGGTAPRVRISVRFDEPMDTSQTTVAWSAASGPVAHAPATWSAEGTELVLEIVGSPLTGQRPLADRTTYEVDLGSQRDAAGNRVEPELGIEAGVLRFTTGVYDPLLNHACGHVVLGPYADVAAAAVRSPVAPRSDVPHTRYTVALPEIAGARSGYTRIRAPSAATWHLFIDGDAPLALEDDAGGPLPLEITPTPDACDGISRRATFQAAALDQRFLRFGPQREPVTRMIVEAVADGN